MPASSRFVQPNRFTIINDVVTLHDHDFPNGAGYDITIAGYMRLYRRNDEIVAWETEIMPSNSALLRPGSSSAVESLPAGRYITYLDEQGRTHIDFPRSGSLYLSLWPGPFYTMDARSHYEDLKRILPPMLTAERNPVITIISDRGPDWSIWSMLVVYYLLLLFKWSIQKYGVVALILRSYQASLSALNPIERAWALVSKILAGYVLNDTLPGESEPPIFQKDLSDEVRGSKTAELFDGEMAAISTILSDPSNTSISEAYVNASPVLSNS